MEGGPFSDCHTMPQAGLALQHIASPVYGNMSFLKSNDIATSLGSTKQNTLDKGHQNGDVEILGGKDHVISFDGQQNEEAVLQRTTCVAQQIQGDQASNVSSQDCPSTVLSTSSPQNGSGDRSNETDMLEDAEEHAVPLQSEGGFDTLDKYAFNLDRDAYSHRVPHHLTTGMLVNVSKLDCRTSVIQHRDEAQKSGLSDVCPPLVPHEHELQERGLKTLQSIWVGMLPSQERTDQDNAIQPQASDDANGAGSSKKPPRKKARPSASIADLNEDDMKIIPFDPNALRVVVKKSDKPRKSWCLYALLNPNQDSLCQGFRVPFERVYFFRQFRDDEAKGFQARQFAIRAKVKAQAFPATPAPDVEQSLATSAVQAFKIPNTETTKARHTLAKNKPDGAPSMTGDVILDRMRNEISRAKQGSEIAGQANVRNSLQSYDRSLSSDSTLEDLQAELENDGLNDLDLDFEDYGNAACVGRAGGEEAYPEHAVAATDANYIEYENEMVGRFLRANSKTALDGSGNQHSKKSKDKISTLETNNDQVASNRNEAIQLSSPSSLCSRGYAVVDEHEPGSQMESQAVVLARRMVDAAIELAAQGDVAVLRQGCRMLDCLKNRGAPPKTGALGLYLNVPTDGTSDASDCAPMFDELLELFPDLDGDAHIDDHVLAWMSRALQLTGQSLDIALVRPCLVAFGERFAARYGAGAPQARVSRDVLVDMICQARDEAEQMLRVEALGRGGGRRGPCSRAELEEEMTEFWTPHVWESPDRAGASGDV